MEDCLVRRGKVIRFVSKTWQNIETNAIFANILQRNNNNNAKKTNEDS